MDQVGSWIDISRPLSERSDFFDGDTPLSILTDQRIEDGCFRVSCVCGSLHLSTHVDAPAHCFADGATVDQIDLNVCIGSSMLLRPDIEAVVSGEDLEKFSLDGASRVLIAGEDITLDESAAAWFVDRGVKLVGCEAMSISPPSCEIQVHQKLLAAGVVVVESLVLGKLPAGWYDLIVMPIRIEGAEASWARAAVRPR